MSTARLKDLDFLSFPELSSALLPVEDQSAFASLSHSEVAEWTDACEDRYTQRIKQLKTYITVVRSLRNASVPAVSRLPNEVLMKIFADSSLTHRDTSIRRVCRQWRAVVLATPSFWVNCMSKKWFGNSSREHRFFSVTVKHSGAMPLSLNIQGSNPVTWSIASELRSRIVGLTHTLAEGHPTSPIRSFFCTGGMERLQTLHMSNTWHTFSMLVDILSNFPLLQYLRMGSWTLNNDPNIGERAVYLPRLRELTIDEIPKHTAHILHLFTEIHARTLVILKCHWHGWRYVFPGGDLQQLLVETGSINRLCLEHSPSDIDTLEAKGHNSIGARLHISCDPGTFRSMQPLIMPIVVLTMNSHYRFCNEICEEVMQWELPHLRRLELYQTAPTTMRTIVAAFLDRHGHRASELSLAWVLPVMAGEDDHARATEELEELENVLRAHYEHGMPRLGRLELYATVRSKKWVPFTGSIEAGSDAHLCTQLVAPFLANMQEVVDVVHFG